MLCAIVFRVITSQILNELKLYFYYNRLINNYKMNEDIDEPMFEENKDDLYLAT